MSAIVVVDGSGVEHEFADATRFSTDDYNNLCLFEGSQADRLVHVFAAGWWREAGVSDGS